MFFETDNFVRSLMEGFSLPGQDEKKEFFSHLKNQVGIAFKQEVKHQFMKWSDEEINFVYKELVPEVRKIHQGYDPSMENAKEKEKAQTVINVQNKIQLLVKEAVEKMRMEQKQKFDTKAPHLNKTSLDYYSEGTDDDKALVDSVYKNNAKQAQLFLQNGARAQQYLSYRLSPGEYLGWSLFAYALVVKGNIELAAALLTKGGDRNRANAGVVAWSCSSPEASNVLPNADYVGITLLTYAIYRKKFNKIILGHLVENGDVDATLPANYGAGDTWAHWPVLGYAIYQFEKSGDKDYELVVKLLLEKGSNYHAKIKHENKSIYNYVLDKGWTNSLNLIMKYGSKTPEQAKKHSTKKNEKNDAKQSAIAHPVVALKAPSDLVAVGLLGQASSATKNTPVVPLSVSSALSPVPTPTPMPQVSNGA